MAKRVGYRCRACHGSALQWSGRCTACGAWDTLDEVAADASRSAPTATPPVPIPELVDCAAPVMATGSKELDRVLAGGLVAGSVTLLGGEPGTGKSTLALQAIAGLARAGRRCLLIAGEEAREQVARRAARIDALADRCYVVNANQLGDVIAQIETLEPDVVVVDSIQTIHGGDTSGSAGSVAQVRDAAQALVRVAKRSNIAMVLIGHVTKDGAIAGPRVLEHIVDTVLTFGGDRHGALRTLHVLKHRYGSTMQSGLFEMTEAGLRDVADPSALLLTDRCIGSPGSIVAPALDGARPVLVEVQALVARCGDAASPRRAVQGIDSSRLALLLAVLERHAGFPLSRSDVFVSVAGGLRLAEPALDLAVLIAVASAQSGLAIAPGLVAIGEVGLGGEIRRATRVEQRLAEASRLVYDAAVVPASTPDVSGMHLLRVATVGEALERCGLGVTAVNR